MKHGISEENWQDYLDGVARPEVRERIDAHLPGCLSCWEFYEQMTASVADLRRAGEEALRAVTLSDPQLHRMLRNVFQELRQETSAEELQTEVQERLDVLQTVMAPYCGPQAAVRVMERAAQHSPALSLADVTTENWEPFLERLTKLAAALCGDTFARLIWERGQLASAR